MKATLKFNLLDPDEKMAYNMVNKSEDMALFIFHLVQNSKKELIYRLENKRMSKFQAIDLVFDRINDLMEEYDININMLVK